MRNQDFAGAVQRFLVATLAFGCCLALVACTKKDPDEQPPARLYNTTISEVIVECDGARLAVNFCREDMVHFRYVPAGEDFAPKDAVPESIAKYDEDYDVVCGEKVEDDTTITLRTEGVTVTVD